jgi:hypothetical protein
MGKSESDRNDDMQAGDPRDYKLDIAGLSSGPASSSPAQGRPYLSILFECCNVYQRIYRSADGKTYQGRCPRCGKTVNFKVGEGGTATRFFRAK